MKQVIIIGASGFGGEVAWVLERMAAQSGGTAIIGFCDDAPGKQCGVWRGLPLLGPVGAAACIGGAAGGEVWFHVAVGGNAARDQATVGHDAVVEAFAQICPGARVSGGCHIGARALLGSNAVVIPGVSIGADATVGATAAALRDVPDGGGVARAGR